MTLKFELTLPRWTKWALGLGLPALVLAGVAAFAAAQWTKPNDFVAGQVISASDMNANFDTLFTAVNDLDSRAAIPGTFMWWWCSSPPCTAPSGWAIADGSTVNDATSTLFGQTLPDMIEAFPMGVEPADVGSIGGENTSTIAVDHPSATTSTDGAHFHLTSMVGSDNGYYVDPFGTSTGPNLTHVGLNTSPGGLTSSYVNTSTAGDHSHTIDLPNLDVPHDNRPAYVGLLPLIKL